MAGHLSRRALEELAQQQPNEDEALEPVSAEAWKLVAGREDELWRVARSLAFVGVGAGSAAAWTETATPEKARAIRDLLVAAYADEEVGPESFRTGPLVDVKTVAAMLGDNDCRWLCCESAQDDDLLGVACVSVNGETATLRFLAVRPALRGLCVGHRLLDRVERSLSTTAVTTLLLCIPSPRSSMRVWAERRGFRVVEANVPFPVENLAFALTRPDARLQVCAKDLSSSSNTPPQE